MPKRTVDYRVGLLRRLKDPGLAAHYLNAAAEDSDRNFLLALRDVAEARQMTAVARRAGVRRESLYRMLSRGGNPKYSSLLGVLSAVGLKVTIEAADARRETSPIRRRQKR